MTAIVDWELAHFGDPMDDIAWVSLRTVQDTFTHLPDRLREYEAPSGHADRRRPGLVLPGVRRGDDVPRCGPTRAQPGMPPPGPAGGARDIGNGLLYPPAPPAAVAGGADPGDGASTCPLPDCPAPGPARANGTRSTTTCSARCRRSCPASPTRSPRSGPRGWPRAVKYLQEIDRRGREYADARAGRHRRRARARPADVARRAGPSWPRPQRAGKVVRRGLRPGVVEQGDARRPPDAHGLGRAARPHVAAPRVKCEPSESSSERTTAR